MTSYKLYLNRYTIFSFHKYLRSAVSSDTARYRQHILVTSRPAISAEEEEREDEGEPADPAPPSLTEMSPPPRLGNEVATSHSRAEKKPRRCR
ncbi:hypothetical protein B296_00044759 [Ensete ventricosum]|uniref:Uncharacterized protein n=1 Tax=Ensete ventricosum TaxID=4639 RepID=A0A426XPI5_ENSVE|nr:hypothetical protein B296_00044759 [Ensete ventricosum]